jgi:hypothetical protein
MVSLMLQQRQIGAIRAAATQITGGNTWPS